MSIRTKISNKELPTYRAYLLENQGHKCALCGISFIGTDQKACVDHDHKTGLIRSVLCLNCNGIEGKIFNLCRRAKRLYSESVFLDRVLKYWKQHLDFPSYTIHPSHKNEDEKRLARNKKARKKRASQKK